MEMEKLVSLCKRRGFLFQSSEIYGGLNGFWDYGPLGVELKRNIKEAWWQDMVTSHDELSIRDGAPASYEMTGLDSTIIMHPQIWKCSGHYDLFHDFMDYCNDMDFPLEGLHCETGPGVWEAALAVDDALSGADKAALFKTFTEVFCQKRDLVATFMAKWSMDYPGQSGHVHQSLVDAKTETSLFYEGTEEHGMSPLMRHYVAGQQKYLKPFLCLCAPTINSYTRLVKGAWAPTAATWGVDNRTTALRVITGTEKSQRVEFRIGPADANPYLIAAASLGAGLLGIEQQIELDKPVIGNAYEQEAGLPSELQLAKNLRDATRDFHQSLQGRELFGDEFVNHFTSSRDWETREHERAVTDWQLQRYFEII